MKKLLIIAIAALLATGCVGRGVKRSLDVAMSFELNDSTLADNANSFGCTMAMTIQQEDTASVLYFTPGGRQVYTMTYVTHDDAHYGRGDTYSADSIRALQPRYTRLDDSTATLCLDATGTPLPVRSIEWCADSLCCRVLPEGQAPALVRLKRYGKARGTDDPLASDYVQRVLALALTLRYPVEEIEADGRQIELKTDSIERALDSATAALDRAMASADLHLDSLDRQLNDHIDGFGQLPQLAQRLGFARQEYHEYNDRAEMRFAGGKCSSDKCHDRMLQMSEEAGRLQCGYTVQHRMGHRSCLFIAEKETKR